MPSYNLAVSCFHYFIFNLFHFLALSARKFNVKSMEGVDIDPSLIERARRNLEFYHALHPQSSIIPAHGEGSGAKSLLKSFYRGTENAEVAHMPTYSLAGEPTGEEEQEEQEEEEPSRTAFPISFPMCLGPLPILDKSVFPGNVSFRVENFVGTADCAVEAYDAILWCASLIIKDPA